MFRETVLNCLLCILKFFLGTPKRLIWDYGCTLNLKCDGTRAETRPVFQRNGRVHLNRRGRQFSRLLAAEVCASAVVMLDTPCSEVVWRVLATHSTRMFPLHFPSLRHSVPSHFNWSLPSLIHKFGSRLRRAISYRPRPLYHRGLSTVQKAGWSSVPVATLWPREVSFFCQNET